MSDIIDINVYPRGSYPLNVYKMNSYGFDFVIGDFNNFSFVKTDYILPYYEIYETVTDNYGQDTEVLKQITYIDKPNKFFINEFSSITNLNTFRGFTNDKLFIFDTTKYSFRIYNEPPNIYKFFTQNQLNEFYLLEHYKLWTTYSPHFTAFKDYKSPIAMHTQVIPEYIERIFFNIDVKYGRTHRNFLKIVEYMEHFLIWEYNPTFFDFLRQYDLKNIEYLEYFKGEKYIESEIIDYEGNKHYPFNPVEIVLFKFDSLFTQKITIKKTDWNRLFQLLELNSNNSNSYIIGGLGKSQYHLSNYLKSNYEKFQFPLYSSTLINENLIGDFFYTQKHYYRDTFLNENNQEVIRIYDSDLITVHYALKKDIDYDKKHNISIIFSDLGDLEESNKKKCCLLDCIKK